MNPRKGKIPITLWVTLPEKEMLHELIEMYPSKDIEGEDAEKLVDFFEEVILREDIKW